MFSYSLAFLFLAESRALDKFAFNQRLRALIFDRLMPNWGKMDAQNQFAAIGKVIRWQSGPNKPPL